MSKRKKTLQEGFKKLSANARDGYYIDGTFHHSKSYEQRLAFIETRVKEAYDKGYNDGLKKTRYE